MPDSPLRAALLLQLGGAPTPTRRRRIALELRSLAEEQEAKAEAEERSGVRVRAIQARERENAAPRPQGGRPKGTGGRFVRIETPTDRSNVVHIAPALLQELGDPARVSIARHDRELRITPAGGDAGYAVTRPTGPRGGMPRIAIGRRVAADLGLAAGRHTAHIDGDAIVWT